MEGMKAPVSVLRQQDAGIPERILYAQESGLIRAGYRVQMDAFRQERERQCFAPRTAGNELIDIVAA